MPAFDTWSRENLVKFAAEAYAKMQEQQERIEHLQSDLKDAIKAYYQGRGRVRIDGIKGTEAACVFMASRGRRQRAH